MISDTSSDTSPSSEIIFEPCYQGPAATQRAAEILNVPPSNDWSIVDAHRNLVLVHYEDGADMQRFGHLRGVLLDLEKGVTVARSFGYTPTAVASSLEGDDVTLVDQEGTSHNFSLATTTIRPIFEGVVIRVIWFEGRAYRFTHRKIEPLRSRWGTSASFLSMYEEAGGPTDQELFDTSSPYSSTCYFFLVCHPSLLVGTRQRVTTPYILYLARQEMDIGREAIPGIESFFLTPQINGCVTEPCVHKPQELTLKEANHHLQYGYYQPYTPDHIRQLTGEAVILFSQGPDGLHLLKLHSPAYEWRLTLRGNNPNLTNQFYILLDWLARVPDITRRDSLNEHWDREWTRLRERLIFFPLYGIEEIRKLYERHQGITNLPVPPSSRSDYASREARITLLWINFVFSLPPSSQGSALDILKQFRIDRQALIGWLVKIEKNQNCLDDPELPTRAKSIITTARQAAGQGAAISTTIKGLINRERGASLYGLVRDMKRALAPPKV